MAFLEISGRATAGRLARRQPNVLSSKRGCPVGSVIKKRRKRMAKKKHRKLLKKTRIQRRNKK
ncbi:MAG: 30S ribosomal protein bS22 [Actinomycetales bacterium]